MRHPHNNGDMERYLKFLVVLIVLALGGMLFYLLALKPSPDTEHNKQAVVENKKSGAITDSPETAVQVDASRVKYVGVENCRICHMPHYESWLGTKMAKSFELLKPGVRAEAKLGAGLDPDGDYTKEGECLKCHVTGYGEPGGFVSIEETPEMANVECEMCHGPGSVYVDMMMEKAGTYTLDDYKELGGLTMPSPENNVCSEKCHNPKSPFVGSGFEFDFEDRKAIGTHRHDLDYIYLPFDI